MAKEKIIEIDVVLKAETEKAYGVESSEDDSIIWLPKSQCEYDHYDMTMQLPDWLAIEKGLV